MPFKIKKQDTAITHEYGDYAVYGDPDKNFFLRTFDENDIKGKNILSLDYFNPNHWNALIKMPTMDGDQLSEIASLSVYSCDYTFRDYVSIIPLCIFSDDVEKYFGDHRPYYFDVATDKRWNMQGDDYSVFAKINVHMGHMDTIILGTGFGEGVSVDDGSFSYTPALMDVEGTDDVILCATLCWHNK